MLDVIFILPIVNSFVTGMAGLCHIVI